MRKIVVTALFVIVSFLAMRGNWGIVKQASINKATEQQIEINGKIKKGETLFDIFKKYKLDPGELFKLKEASASVHRLREIYPDRPYKIVIDGNNQINAFVYWIDDGSVLNITRTDAGFSAVRQSVDYEKRTLHLGGVIKDTLITSLGEGRENFLLAIQLSDVFAWDIDFTTDLRNGDTFKLVVEGLYLDGEFKKYGDIVSAEFVNNGECFHAYRFEHNGKADYYDEEGRTLRKVFLKAPLSFRRISSGFSQGRFHPVLKIYRPHHGLDFAAPANTPVSAMGDGTIMFSGYKGDYGNLIVMRHPNGWNTFYGHLSKIPKDIKTGRKIKQGEVIGYVGSTGLSTGPHLHYEMRINNRPVNPLLVKSPRGNAVPKKLMTKFRELKSRMNEQIASIAPQMIALAGKQEYR